MKWHWVLFCSAMVSTAAELPAENTGIAAPLTVSQILEMDDYDDPAVKRPGNPEVIPEKNDSGLLARSGLGVYRTLDLVKIPLRRTVYRLPQKPHSWFTTGLRIQSFGRLERNSSSLSFHFSEAKQQFELKIIHDAKSNQLICVFLDNGKKLNEIFVPYRTLPADFQFSAAADGSVQLYVKGMKSARPERIRSIAVFFAGLNGKPFETTLHFRNEYRHDRIAETVIDNYMTGLAAENNRTGR